MKKIALRVLLIGVALAFPLMGAHAENAERTEAEKAFRAADVVNDGRIDAGEFDMYRQRVFRALDTNGDDDVNEFCAFYRESMPCTFTAATEKLMENN